MTRRSSAASIVASPVLVGAVTVLIAIVAVFLAYNANRGLPFVPTYDVTAQMPSGYNLVPGNDVRIGGFRVGTVDKIRGATDERTGKAIALLDMKLDREVQPLPRDTSVFVRPRSALGLKYVEITPGKSSEGYDPGAVIPLANNSKRRVVEFDEFFSTYDAATRDNQRTTLKGFGDAFAGRGRSINVAIENLVPFMTHLEPVARMLSDPKTQLDEFFKQAGRTSAQLAPVAGVYANLFGNMATTFEALSRSPESLRNTIERSPRTLDAGIRNFARQRPFLRDSERLFTELEPTARQFRISLPAVTRAFRTGIPVLRRSPVLYSNTREVLSALYELARNPNTLLGLKDLTTTLQVAAPLVTYVNPYQSVCNYWNYYWTAISEHVSAPVRDGTAQRTNLKTDNGTQDNRLSASDADKPADIAANVDPNGATNGAAGQGQPLVALHRQAYEPAIDAQGNADCQVGQRGYIDGPLVNGNRYAGEDGGQHVVLDSNIPGLSGPTFKGVPNLKDVP